MGDGWTIRRGDARPARLSDAAIVACVSVQAACANLARSSTGAWGVVRFTGAARRLHSTDLPTSLSEQPLAFGELSRRGALG
jgi:hypothetical protein